MEKEKKKFDDLKFVRLRTDSKDDPDGSLAHFMFSRIPSYLFEQVKGADFKIDRIYQFGPLLLASPLTFFYALVNKETSVIKGILWAEINPLSENLAIHILSVDKEYQGNGTLDKALDFVRVIQKEQNLQKIQITTICPKTYERKHGWSESKKRIMEVS